MTTSIVMATEVHKKRIDRNPAAGKSVSATFRLKAEIADKIAKAMNREGLSVREAQTLTGVAAADFSRVRNEKLQRFTIDRLLVMLEGLGQIVDVVLSVASGPETGIAHPLLRANRKAIRALCRRFAVRHLGVFGSILRNDFDADKSDIDFAVAFGKSASYSPAEQYFEFKVALEHLLGRSVDLVELSATPASRLKRIIEKTQVPVYGKAA
jgi:predicted nucleotidyltransferase/predicted XRE-type DNA-binding protein